MPSNLPAETSSKSVYSFSEGTIQAHPLSSSPVWCLEHSTCLVRLKPVIGNRGARLSLPNYKWLTNADKDYCYSLHFCLGRNFDNLTALEHQLTLEPVTNLHLALFFFKKVKVWLDNEMSNTRSLVPSCRRSTVQASTEQLRDTKGGKWSFCNLEDQESDKSGFSISMKVQEEWTSAVIGYGTIVAPTTVSSIPPAPTNTTALNSNAGPTTQTNSTTALPTTTGVLKAILFPSPLRSKFVVVHFYMSCDLILISDIPIASLVDLGMLTPFAKSHSSCISLRKGSASSSSDWALASSLAWYSFCHLR
ncbi:hypothetical protein LXG23DRAFT_37528 [Yarrowia lipolytica]|nr:hypothetical protein BKA91DRAFT_162788 [Yarrowia lipolytica]KAE8171702.1 hypothetical protein BKA90DRAFT_157704 [Yarrowia lipolytica]KAJ8053366.1 hypothetical protein LXG23DRAFT_37528 [Yarrowia lipolytica]RMI95347.1 hypothetical protein BD777DRAFT_163093 [Yarrowia lipolytica]